MLDDRYICTHCGATMRAPKKVSGMGCWVTILLFVLFVISIVTFLWMLTLLLLIADAIIYYSTLKKNCCTKCKGKECVIPINTLMGQKLLRDISAASKDAVAPTTSTTESSPDSGKIVYDTKTHQYVKR